jgi:hypothetical protein
MFLLVLKNLPCPEVSFIRDHINLSLTGTFCRRQGFEVLQPIMRGQRMINSADAPRPNNN